MSPNSTPTARFSSWSKNDEEGPAFPLLLSETGAFTDTANMVPAPFLIPYDVNSPLWSDGTLKKRWVVMPNDGAPVSAQRRASCLDRENMSGSFHLARCS